MTPPARTLSDWLTRIEAMHPAEIELGLERVAEVYRRLPKARVPAVISVAGTNGKGSTVECIRRCALANGWRVGAYTSPHLVHFNERICIDESNAGDADIVAAFAAVEAARNEVPLTYFEFTTLAALALFRAADLDLWVLEVGLGGRLDAVNVVDADVAVITAIGLDHQDWLGDTRDAIAAEKAGIMRPGRIAVCSDPDAPNPIAEHARTIGTTLFQIGRDFAVERQASQWTYSCRLSLPGQSSLTERSRSELDAPLGAVLNNLAGALTAMTALNALPAPSALEPVFENWSHPGRLQRVRRRTTWWLDVAHNRESVQHLVSVLEREHRSARPKQCIVVVGMLGDKPVDDVLQSLASVATHWCVASLDSPRALSAQELAAKVNQVSAHTVERFDSVAGAMAVARARAGARDCVVVTGSFHTVGPALAWLGYSD